MKSTGVTRPVDELGRIVIPKELRTNLNINIGDRVEIFTEGKDIILRKFERGCIFCGELNGVSLINDKIICAKCRNELRG
jgi:transcriptional pleiotropic regulator of transition state genes